MPIFIRCHDFGRARITTFKFVSRFSFPGDATCAQFIRYYTIIRLVAADFFYFAAIIIAISRFQHFEEVSR